MNLDAALQQQLLELCRCVRILLVGRDDERKRPASLAGVDRAMAHVVEVLNDLLAVGRHGMQQPVHRAHVVLDDVTQPPRSAGPRLGKSNLRLVLGQPLLTAAQIESRHVNRRGGPHVGGLRQQTHCVVPERRRVLVPRPVIVVQPVRQDAGVVVVLKLEGHRAAEEGSFAPHEGIVVWIDRIVVGGREEAGSRALHLVHREEHLRMPLGVEEPREVPVLRHVHHERVAIDVVAEVLVIEPRHGTALQRRALLLVVPIDDQPMAVRIERRDQDEDDVLQNVERVGIAGRRERIQQLVGGLRGPHFRRMDAAANGEDRLVRGHDLTRLVGRERSRIRQTLVRRADAFRCEACMECRRR